MTIQLEFTPEILKELYYHRYRHLAPLVQRRMEVLWLKSHDLPHALIAQLADLAENTIRDYFQLYLEGGVEKLKEVNFFRPESELVTHVTSLEAYFREHPPATIKEAQSEIASLTGIQRSETQVAAFLKKNSICVAAKSACSPPKRTPTNRRPISHRKLHRV